MMQLLNLEMNLNQMIEKIKKYSMEVDDYLCGMNQNLTNEEASNLLTEIPYILENLNELLNIYVESVEEKYAKL